MLKKSFWIVTFSTTAMLSIQPAGARASSGRSLTASGIACPAKASLSKLSALGSIYIGELHGTNESPRLLECLVDYEVKTGIYPLTVSLELQPFSRDTKSLVWSGQDGRSSRAMARVVNHLEVLEKAGSIALNFQLPANPVGHEIDKEIGSKLRDLANTGRVIAYGGNFHAQRRQVMLPGVSIKPAGAYMGRAIKNVLIVSTGSGKAWGCMKSGCGINNIKSRSPGGKSGTMVDGKKFGYDYVYYVPPYTASVPKYPPVKKKAVE